MIVRLIALIAVVGLVIFGIGWYLSPDDLEGCDIENPTIGGQCSQADAIVVVSGGDTAARTSEAIRLYQNGWAEYIIFSGAAADKEGPSNAEVMRQQAINSGVPTSATLIEERSETTRQNAEQVLGKLERREIDSVILVTSGYHMRRAGLEFSRQLGDTELRRHPVSSDQQWSSAWWLTPWGWWTATSELLKIGLFYLGGSR